MEARNFVKCLFGGITLGGATTFMASVTNDGFGKGSCLGYSNNTTPYYSGLFEEDDAVHIYRKQYGNMPPSYVGDSNIKMEKPL